MKFVLFSLVASLAVTSASASMKRQDHINGKIESISQPGRCLDLYAGTVQVGTSLTVKDCQTARKWDYIRTLEGEIKLSDTAMAISDIGPDEGPRSGIMLLNDSQSKEQKFTFHDNGRIYYMSDPPKCLELSIADEDDPDFEPPRWTKGTASISLKQCLDKDDTGQYQTWRDYVEPAS
ncbi:uncharacterized protein IL334_007153 [Kwoniella shivajii]|uniref:Ricin B lectin domain-containing protein n=1 Tax=Kwoniella shivajii TaxID=564305 RepID=A0ABZ1DA55_9TREE|nr:hypothetical protein IL334_007153 [Kwoniella shivajii]